MSAPCLHGRYCASGCVWELKNFYDHYVYWGRLSCNIAAKGSGAYLIDLTLVAVKMESLCTLACAKVDGRAADVKQTST